jgi:hypothetical protein
MTTNGRQSMTVAAASRATRRAALACILATSLGGAGCGDLPDAAGEGAAGDEVGDGVTVKAGALGGSCTAPDPSQGVSCPAGFNPTASATTLRCSRVDQSGYDAACPAGASYVQNDGGADSCRKTVGLITVVGPTVPCLPGYTPTTGGRDRCVGPAVTAWAYPLWCAGTSPANGATCLAGATADTSGGARLRCSRHLPGLGISANCPGTYVEVRDGRDFCLTTSGPFTIRVSAVCPPGYEQITAGHDNCISDGSDVWEQPISI